MRKRIFEIIEVAEENDKLSSFYDWFMMAVIAISIIPLAFKTTDYPLFNVIDKVTVVIFIIDYLLRWITADFKLNKKKAFYSFLLYPITPMAIIDLVSILPSLSIIGSGFKLLKVLRLIRTLRVFRVFKAVRYSKSIKIILDVMKNSRKPLITVFGLAIGYVLICALVIFNVEPETFDNFFEAIYWASVSLTTMGYGDIYPVTTTGRIITMLSAFVGIAIVALPSGIITAGYMAEIEKTKDGNDE